jgi:hypothetical protein
VIGREDDIVKNGATGERVRFILTATETGGELLVMEDHWTRPGHAVPRHVHGSFRPLRDWPGPSLPT